MTDEKQAVKILAIDDDEMLCDVVAVYLSENGYDTLKAHSGADGLQQFGAHRPDLVLLDIRMPEMSGTEVLKQLIDESPETPVIMVSATSDLTDVVDVLRLGAWDYVVKPIGDMNLLLHAIGRALDRAGILRENRRYKEHLEQEVLKRTTELADVNEAMERKNIALEELIGSVQSQQSQVGQSIVKNVETVIGPQLQSLREGLPYDKQRTLDQISEHLREITSPFAASLSQEFVTLSPTEIRVCKHIQSGMTNKEIAAVEHVAVATVKKHRERIRKKLGITNTEVNLASFLMQHASGGFGA
jgi:DNA-binding NarL/FixJ family response regulator